MPALPLTTIFTKRPVPGEVKTRLVPPLTEEQAAELALAMLDDAVAAHLAEPAYTTAVAVTPTEAVPWLAARHRGPTVAAQEGPDLGARLAAWFARALADHPSVVVVGADCPLLAPATVRAAHEALGGGAAELVLAPDAGGGYALVGLSRAAPELFEVPMSVSDNLQRTLDAARALGLRVRLLPEERDVDGPADLMALARALRTSAEAGRTAPPFPARTAALLETLPLAAPLP